MGDIYLLRHGQASFGSDDYDRLSPLGHEQSRQLGEGLARCKLNRPRLIRGDMRRHRETLEACDVSVEEPAEVDARWNELDHRALLVAAFPQYPDAAALRAAVADEEKPRAAFQRMFELSVARWMGGAHDSDYAETWTQFVDRVSAALSSAVEASTDDRDTVVSTSGGPIGIVMAQLLGLPPERGMALTRGLVNASYTHLLVRRSQPRLCCFNVHAHLDQTTYR